MAIIVRKAEPADYPQLQRLIQYSFGYAAMGIVHRLYLRHEFLELLVAEDNNLIIGVQAIATATITFNSKKPSMNIGALLSISVHSDYTNNRVEHALLESSLRFCRNAQFQAAVATSLCPCYREYRFKNAGEFNIRGESHLPADALMIAELETGIFSGESGIVRYQLSQPAL